MSAMETLPIKTSNVSCNSRMLYTDLQIAGEVFTRTRLKMNRTNVLASVLETVNSSITDPLISTGPEETWGQPTLSRRRSLAKSTTGYQLAAPPADKANLFAREYPVFCEVTASRSDSDRVDEPRRFSTKPLIPHQKVALSFALRFRR